MLHNVHLSIPMNTKRFDSYITKDCSKEQAIHNYNILVAVTIAIEISTPNSVRTEGD